jgi:hypothetical protein
MGSSDLSDGFWVWPEGLAHYIEDHHVVLPDDFIRHVLAAPSCRLDCELPELATQPDGSSRLPVTYEFWLNWARDHGPA